MKENKKILFRFFVISLLVTLTLSVGCSKKEDNEENIVKGFIENFFTNTSEDVDIYKEYFTEEAFEYFKTDGYIISRVPDKLNNKFNTEIKDMNVENISKSDSDTHSYEVKLTLIDKDSNKERECKNTIHLSEENGKWRINSNNKIDLLSKDIFLLFSE